MTIAIKITNADTRETAIVAVKVKSTDGREDHGTQDVQLKGGEETTKYVHSGQILVVEEIKNG